MNLKKNTHAFIFTFFFLFSLVIPNFLFPRAVNAAAAGTVSSVCTTQFISFTINVYGVGNGLITNDIWYQLDELGGSNQVILDSYEVNDALTQLQINIPLNNPSSYSAGQTVNVHIAAVEFGAGLDPFIDGDYSCVVQTVTDPTPPITNSPTPPISPTPTQCASGTLCVDLGIQCTSLKGTPISSPNYCQTATNGIGDCCLPENIPTPPVITPPPPPSGPIPAEFIPCNEEDIPEYHSRRPYQASPCNPNLEELDLYCANDFITKETFTVSPTDADSCVADGGGQTCFFSFDSVLEVSIDLTDAELPIVGNTQLVPNQVNGGQPQPEQFSYVRRVNEYLTSWLDGAPWKADEELMDPDEIDITYPQKHLITYGGPIRKLFPKQSQFQSRSDRRGQTALGYSHNQIYICESGNDQIPCRYDAARGQYGIINTNGTADPADDEFIPTEYTRILSGTPESPWMPFTSTEDRLGAIYANIADSTPQPTAGEGNEVTITSYDFVPENDTDLLYFAHMEEAVSLVDLLQRTYTPREIARGVPRDSEPASYYNTYRCDLKDVRWNSGDDLFGELDGRGGQYGDLPAATSSTGSETTGQNISGLINYSGQFQCHFDTSFASQADCVQDCSTDLNQCDPDNNALIPDPYADCASYCQNEVCSIPTCTVDALTATSLYTETPKAEELWDRTVVGEASLVKRMFPSLGHFGEIVKDYPAVTSGDYIAEKAEGGTQFTSIVSSLAGDPTEEDPGSNAELYIPHLGGIKVLTMGLLQDMLRPKELGSKYLESGIPPGSDPTNCKLGDGICSPENLATYFSDGSIQKGLIASIICERESGGYAQALNNSCTYSHDGLNNDGDASACVDGADNSSNPQCTPRIIAGQEYYFDGATLDYSAGLFQHNLLVVCPGLRSGQGTLWDWDNPPWCTVGSPGYPYCNDAPWCEFDTGAFEACKNQYFDPVFNIQEMVRRSSDGTSWGPWCTGNAAADCGIPGC